MLDSPTYTKPPTPKFTVALARSKYATIEPETSNSISIRSRKEKKGILLSGPAVDKVLSKLGISLASLDNSNGSGSSLNTNRVRTSITSMTLLSPGRRASTSVTDSKSLHELAVIDNLVFRSTKQKFSNSFFSSKECQLYYQLQIIISSKLSKKNFLNETEFDTIRLLGRGGFGAVSGCRSSLTGKLYALKIMNKKRIKSKRAMKMCLSERYSLELNNGNSPYIISLKYSFQNNENLYLVLDLMIGGDLSYHLNEGLFTIEQSKYYTARIIAAIAFLHDHHLVYRDLKPENILLDAEGYSKLSDLG
jgi:hypothetical protein